MPVERLQQAHSLHCLGKYSEASKLYQDFLKKNPRHIGAHNALGLALCQSGQFDQAQYYLNNALQLKPLSLETLSLLGFALLKLRRYEEALECFNRALSVNPGFVDALSNRATAYLELNRLSEAVADFDAALVLAPNHAVSWSNRGNTLAALGRFSQAVASYDRAIALVPDFQEALANRKYALGMAHFAAGQFELAQSTLGEALMVNPHLPDALCVRGIALLRLRQHQGALDCFNLVLAANPKLVEALTNRGTTFLELNRLDEALADFDSALAIDRSHAVGWNNRGNALMKLQRHEEALTCYETALSNLPEFSEARDNRETALFALRRMSRCPPGYMRALFDNYSTYYDASMVETLGYRGHLHLRSLAARVLTHPTSPLHILDLGCGTGLVGEAFKDLARGGCLDGIDISSRMIAAARIRGIYDDLTLGDIETVLTRPGRSYDLILAADTMVYFGDLSPTFAGVTERLKPSGFYLFAVESMPGGDWEQTPANRFRHSETYLRTAASMAGLHFVDIMPCLLRHEQREPVFGFAVALQKQASSVRQ
jgi:predicted TPR repeat methyltransferase